MIITQWEQCWNLKFRCLMVYRVRILLFVLFCVFQSNNLKSQVNLDDFSIVVIGNDLGLSSLSESMLKNCFKGKYNNWPNKKAVVIALPSSKHKKVELYSSLLYNKSFYSVKKYWYSLVFQGRNDPPYFFGSDEEIIEFVKSTPGAIGIVIDTNQILEKLKIQVNE